MFFWWHNWPHHRKGWGTASICEPVWHWFTFHLHVQVAPQPDSSHLPRSSGGPSGLSPSKPRPPSQMQSSLQKEGTESLRWTPGQKDGRTKWQTYARNAEFDGIKSSRCYAEHRAQQIPYLSPGQQELLETLHLFAVICCSLLDKQSPVRDEATSKKGASQVEQLVSSPWGRWASCHSCWWGRWADLSGRGTRLPSSAQNFPPPPGNIHPTSCRRTQFFK